MIAYLPQALVSGFLMGLIYSLVSVGLTIIWGVMDIINFAHGDFLMLAMFIAFWFYTLFGFDPLVSIPLAAIGIFLLASITYRLLIKRILKESLLTTLLATFGLALFLRNSAQFLWRADYRTILNPVLQGSFSVAGIYVSIPKLVGALISVITVTLVYVFMKKTRIGRAIQAVSMDREAALLMGINADRIYNITFGIGGACVGIAGALLANFYPVSPQAGIFFVIIAFTCVALGGFGSILGSLIAGVIIGIVESVGGFLIGPAFKYAIVFLIYLLVVLIRPKGLFGW
ncbi:MAG: branched-chain amino acid ABC transporter permease [Thermoprotei archaeon]|nr:MAG: branched-chain amino acid ABC transporter permease [Thermoprotei archaeon]